MAMDAALGIAPAERLYIDLFEPPGGPRAASQRPNKRQEV